MIRSRFLPLDPDKYLPAVEPPTEGPEDAEDEEACGEGAGGAGEEVVAEPGLAEAADPAGCPDLVFSGNRASEGCFHYWISPRQLAACQLGSSNAQASRPHRLTIPGVYSHPAAGQGGALVIRGCRLARAHFWAFFAAISLWSSFVRFWPATISSLVILLSRSARFFRANSSVAPARL